ncbi:hypothetical protein L9F63_007313, partial [Diploptera punctata]
LLIDSQIRFWVFLPIVIIAFLNGTRSRLLREHGKYLTYHSFQMRQMDMLQRGIELRSLDASGLLLLDVPKSVVNFKNTLYYNTLLGNVADILTLIAIYGVCIWPVFRKLRLSSFNKYITGWFDSQLSKLICFNYNLIFIIIIMNRFVLGHVACTVNLAKMVLIFPPMF